MKQLLVGLPAGPLPDRLEVDATTRRRLERVLRLAPGTILRLADGTGRRVQARWLGDAFQPVAEPEHAYEPGPELELAVGLIKGERWDWLIEKAVELGVASVAPLQLRHCVVRVGPEDTAKVARWQSIAAEAFEQCGRPTLPTVRPPARLDRWLEGRQGLVLVADERPGARPLAEILKQSLPARLSLVVGPEGGLEESERQLLARHGVTFVNLSENVLRAETAALAAAVIVRHLGTLP